MLLACTSSKDGWRRNEHLADCGDEDDVLQELGSIWRWLSPSSDAVSSASSTFEATPGDLAGRVGGGAVFHHCQPRLLHARSLLPLSLPYRLNLDARADDAGQHTRLVDS